MSGPAASSARGTAWGTTRFARARPVVIESVRRTLTRRAVASTTVPGESRPGGLLSERRDVPVWRAARVCPAAAARTG
ncbi:hypothetical protein [Nocardia sp. N2S4-5]|uniref:hypothetical protein n=1 Tax=Nocardia sp. N2S4-5 TaxID=3351565 RepID=UPI0037D1B6AF